VEDEEAVRAFAGPGTHAGGYTVYEAASWAEALDLMLACGSRSTSYSDLVMPGMDGPTLMRELRRRSRTEDHLRLRLRRGCVRAASRADEKNFQFLPKPFSLKELATTVKDARA